MWTQWGISVRPGLERLRDPAAKGNYDDIDLFSDGYRKYAYQILLMEEFKRKGGGDFSITKGNDARRRVAIAIVDDRGIRERKLERSRRGKNIRRN